MLTQIGAPDDVAQAAAKPAIAPASPIKAPTSGPNTNPIPNAAQGVAGSGQPNEAMSGPPMTPPAMTAPAIGPAAGSSTAPKVLSPAQEWGRAADNSNQSSTSAPGSTGGIPSWLSQAFGGQATAGGPASGVDAAMPGYGNGGLAALVGRMFSNNTSGASGTPPATPPGIVAPSAPEAGQATVGGVVGSAPSIPAIAAATPPAGPADSVLNYGGNGIGGQLTSQSLNGGATVGPDGKPIPAGNPEIGSFAGDEDAIRAANGWNPAKATNGGYADGTDVASLFAGKNQATLDPNQITTASPPSLNGVATSTPQIGPAGAPADGTPSTPASTPALGAAAPAGAPAGTPAGVGLSQVDPNNDLRSQSILPTDAVDRTKLMNDRMQNYQNQELPQFQAKLRSLFQDNAALGRTGSGMLRTDVGNLDLAEQNAMNSKFSDLASNATEGGIQDAINNRNEYRTERGYQTGQEQNAYDRGIQNVTLQDALTNSQFGRSLAQNTAGQANNPAAMSQFMSQLFGQQGSAAASAAAAMMKSNAANNTVNGGSSGGGAGSSGGIADASQAADPSQITAYLKSLGIDITKAPPGAPVTDNSGDYGVAP